MCQKKYYSIIIISDILISFQSALCLFATQGKVLVEMELDMGFT